MVTLGRPALEKAVEEVHFHEKVAEGVWVSRRYFP